MEGEEWAVRWGIVLLGGWRWDEGEDVIEKVVDNIDR